MSELFEEHSFEHIPEPPVLRRSYKGYCSALGCTNVCYTYNKDRTGGFCTEHDVYNHSSYSEDDVNMEITSPS